MVKKTLVLILALGFTAVSLTNAFAALDDAANAALNKSKIRLEKLKATKKVDVIQNDGNGNYVVAIKEGKTIEDKQNILAEIDTIAAQASGTKTLSGQSSVTPVGANNVVKIGQNATVNYNNAGYGNDDSANIALSFYGKWMGTQPDFYCYRMVPRLTVGFQYTTDTSTTVGAGWQALYTEKTTTSTETTLSTTFVEIPSGYWYFNCTKDRVGVVAYDIYSVHSTPAAVFAITPNCQADCTDTRQCSF